MASNWGELASKWAEEKHLKIEELNRQAETLFSRRSYNALVVESSRNCNLRCQGALEVAGFSKVEGALNPNKAIELISPDLDLIVSEVVFPARHMDGVEFLGKVMGEYAYPGKEIPFIFYTQFANYRDNFLTWRADAYVIKHQGLAELARTAKRVIATRHNERLLRNA